MTDRRFVRGVPELIVEISHTTRYTDLGPKLDDYERAGVPNMSCERWNPMRCSGMSWNMNALC